MKTWYCVVTMFADDHTSANIVDTIEEAEKFVKED